jgi:hypothetical protein
MKKLLSFAALTILVACNNSKKEDKQTPSSDADAPKATEVSNAPADTPPPAVSTSTVSYSISDTARTVSGSALVQKDKDKVSPGNDLFAMITANSSNGETFNLNFVFTPKPGVYPVVGLSFSRSNEVFGGLLGGKPKLTNYKVNLTQCEDMGSNGLGGKRWKISGSVDEEVTIDAMGIMKMDKSHPDNIKVSKISFANLTFDDNWEQLLEEGMKKLK